MHINLLIEQSEDHKHIIFIYFKTHPQKACKAPKMFQENSEVTTDRRF